eukprot:scaffold13572_cov56-Attheya_sp.AAC.1
MVHIVRERPVDWCQHQKQVMRCALMFDEKWDVVRAMFQVPAWSRMYRRSRAHAEAQRRQTTASHNTQQ